MTIIQLKNSTAVRKRPDPSTLTAGEIALNLNNAEPGLFFTSTTGELIKVGPVAVGTSPPNTSPNGFPGNCIGELWADSNSVSSGYLPLNVYTSNGWKPAYTPSTLLGITTNTTTALGFNANQAGNGVAIGVNAGSGWGNFGANAVAIGYQTNGSQVNDGSVFIGYRAAGAQTGTRNNDEVFIGIQSGENSFNAEYSVGVGARTLQNARSGNNTAVGFEACKALTTGSATAMGYQALTALTTGTQNTAFGYQALNQITTGTVNTAVGHQAGSALTGAASGNVCLGYQAGPTGAASNNVCFGNQAGNNVTGSGNIFIGIGSGSGGGNGNNNTIIGPYKGSIQGLNGNVLLVNGDGQLTLQFNENGAMRAGANYGTPGAPLISNGSTSFPEWGQPGTTGTFQAGSKTITVVNGLIISAV